MIPSGKDKENYRYHFKWKRCSGNYADRGRKIPLLSSSSAAFARNYIGGFTADLTYAGSGESLNEAGIHAAYINSSLTEGQINKALSFAARGVYTIIYVAPERLETASFLASRYILLSPW